MMANLNEIVAYLDTELQIATVPDYSGAMNGLQLKNDGNVSKVGSAVDASLPTIVKAIEAGVDLLIVHHGMFWHGAQKLVGAQYEKIKLAMDANLAIYSAHIPLDIHPLYGNNVLLSQLIGMNEAEAYHDWKGVKLGLRQRMDIELGELLQRVEAAVGTSIHYCKGAERDSVGMVGVITGGAGSELQSMVDEGVNTFITGEGPHWSYPLAEELGVNIIYAGHYATETFGVRKLMDLIAEQFSMSKYFVFHPTGL